MKAKTITKRKFKFPWNEMNVKEGNIKRIEGAFLQLMADYVDEAAAVESDK